ncbi:MAG: patatin-like phospholipase family protein [Eggerthellaceae bacterium]|nr:patatin-like phospholipase family protein [Eggerthellaceae bacterium]
MAIKGTHDFALVLSGGAAKGIYHIGALKAIQEYGLNITAMSGSSVGGLNAVGLTFLDLARIEEMWDAFRFDNFYTAADSPDNSLSSQTGVRAVIEELVTEDIFPVSKPVYVTIADSQGTPEYIDLAGRPRREVIDLLLATCAMPIVFSPVNFEGEAYMDGGVVDNLPVLPIYLDGYRDVISISASQTLTIDKDKYFFNNLIEITPSKDLGGILDGTLNFSVTNKAFAKELGYLDAKRAIEKYLIEHDMATPDMVKQAQLVDEGYGYSTKSYEQKLAEAQAAREEADYQNARKAAKHAELEDRISSTFDKLEKFL